MKLPLLIMAALLSMAATGFADPVINVFDQNGFGLIAPDSPASSIDFLNTGDQFTVRFEASGELSLQNPAAGPGDLYGFQLDVSFDPTLVQLVNIQEDGYFAQNGTGLSYSIGALSSGELLYVGDTQASAAPGENLTNSSPGWGDPLVELTFVAIAPGQTTVSIPQNSDLYFEDSNGNYTIPAAGTDYIDVSGSPTLGSGGPQVVPEPAAWRLTTGGLLFLGLAARRRRRR